MCCPSSQQFESASQERPSVKNLEKGSPIIRFCFCDFVSAVAAPLSRQLDSPASDKNRPHATAAPQAKELPPTALQSTHIHVSVILNPRNRTLRSAHLTLGSFSGYTSVVLQKLHPRFLVSGLRASMAINKYLRRRLLPTAVVAAAVGVGVDAIEWSSTTSSSSDFISTAPVGEITTIVIGPNDRASIDFVGDPSNHFAVSYRQCSTEDPQPLQIQYSEKLNYEAFPGGCIYAENEAALIGESGCTFWQYNPSETYQTNGIIYEDMEPLEPGRVRFENRGNENATVDVVMFSEELAVPVGMVDGRVWIEDDYTKVDRVINTSVNVYFNNDNSYCEVFDCTVSGYVSDYVEGQDSQSLCQVLDSGEALYKNERFSNPISFYFDLPEGSEHFVTVVLSAKNSSNAAGNYSSLVEYGLNEIVVFQTDTTQPDNSARMLAGLSVMTLAWIVLFNTLLSSVASIGVERGGHVPSISW